MATKYYKIACDGLYLVYYTDFREGIQYTPNHVGLGLYEIMSPQERILNGEIVKALTQRDLNSVNVQSIDKQHNIRNLDMKYLKPVDKKTETMLRLLYG